MGEHGEMPDGGVREGALLLVTLPDGSSYALPVAALAAYRVDPASERLYREILAEPAAPGFEYGDDEIAIRSAGPQGRVDGLAHRRAREDG